MIGRFPSLKLRRMVAFESLIEQDCLYVLDYEQDVLHFEEQPLTIEYSWQGKVLHYTPDFHVLRGQRHELVECKPHKLLDTDENQRKFAAARGWCQENDWVFSVVTDHDLRSGPRLANIKLLTRYARTEVTPTTINCVTTCLRDAETPQTLLEVAHFLDPDNPRQGIAMLLHMAFHHQIGLSITAGPISPDIPICLDGVAS